jgi:excisionase family DNA binding protein
MENITFDEVPTAISKLFTKLNEIEQLIMEQNNQLYTKQEIWFDLEQLVNYDPEKRTKPTFYGYVHSRTIPFHKRGKKLLFLKSEIDTWLKEGRRKTRTEIENDAGQNLIIRRTSK